jgi:uncharacterized protein YceK
MLRSNRAIAGIAILGMSMLTGCGTFLSTIGPSSSDGAVFFQGVQTDLKLVNSGCETNQPILAVFAIADTPVSATADTVLFGCALACLPVLLLEDAVEKLMTHRPPDARPTTTTAPATPPAAEPRRYNENESP